MEYLWNCSLSELVIISLVLNFGLYFLSIGTYWGITYFGKRNTIQVGYQRVERGDILLSIFVVICNASVMVLSVYLVKNSLLVIGSSSIFFSVLEVIVILLAMDFAMYVFHRLAHNRFLFNLIQGSHHTHTSTNAISLFVLHPLEAIGFGLILISVLMLYPFSEIAISIYLIVNLIWGTLGHLNIEIFPSKFKRIFLIKSLCTVTFHNYHHQSPHYNFGFYTNIWDKVFRTYKAE